jgi:polysaccharide export outer membrane protein
VISRRNLQRNMLRRGSLLILALVAFASLGGCGLQEVDSWMDPSKTGRFEHWSTSVPIIDRIDAIEQRSVRDWTRATQVTPEDLIPSDLSYRLIPGDIITVEIFELYATGVWTTLTRRVDAGGMFRIPEIGDVRAAGQTAQEFEDRVLDRLRQDVMPNPLVNVVVEEGSAFKYTLYGAVQDPGVFTLRDPDLRILDALAISGGVPISTKKVYVIRQVNLTDETKRPWERDEPAGTGGGAQPATPTGIDVESLIEELNESDDMPSPGVLRADGEPAIDIEDLQSVSDPETPSVDIEDVDDPTSASPAGGGQGGFEYDPVRDEWVEVPSSAGAGTASPGMPRGGSGASPMVLERVIEVDYQKLQRGDSSLNIVIRPNDRIYVEGPEQGVVYIDGEVTRPGVYQLPFNGRLTLSRLITSAGGLGAIAIPERVDLTRVVGGDRQATIRVDLAAIRNGTEPDLYLHADDHVIIGTSFLATPLAVIRNGFRATYGFGFLLDRNFGNDVFGAPPVNQVGQ